MDYKKIAKETIGYLYKAHASIRTSGIDHKLVALAELRTSQLNECAFCCSFHANELRKMEISQTLIDRIPGYKHSVSFTELQLLVLHYSDAVTLLSDERDRLKGELLRHLSDRQLVELTASISLMNALNRLRISLGEKF